MGTRGSVTILALWAMAIVFALVIAAGFTTRSELLISRNEVTALRAREAADAGTQLGLARLLARRAHGTTIFTGSPETWQDGATHVVLAIEDEAGKIDLNQAPIDLIAGLFQSVGRPQEEAWLLACRVVLHRGGAAQGCPEPDQAAPEPQALFAAPEQLAGLPGFSDALYAAVADSVTVASGSSAIDPMVAPRTVLLALPGASATAVDGWISGRTALAELSPESSGFEALPDAPYFTVSPARDFTIAATATTAEGAVARARLEIRLTGNAARPYEVFAMRAGGLEPAKLGP